MMLKIQSHKSAPVRSGSCLCRLESVPGGLLLKASFVDKEMGGSTDVKNM